MSWENQKRVKAPGIWCSMSNISLRQLINAKKKMAQCMHFCTAPGFLPLVWENTFLVRVNLGTAAICHSYELWVHANIFLIEMPKTRLERQLGVQLKAATFNSDICAAPKYLFVCVYLHLYVYLYCSRDNSTQSRYMWSHVKSHVSTISHLDAHPSVTQCKTTLIFYMPSMVPQNNCSQMFSLVCGWQNVAEFDPCQKWYDGMSDA
jgi:hypothetical protein